MQNKFKKITAGLLFGLVLLALPAISLASVGYTASGFDSGYNGQYCTLGSLNGAPYYKFGTHFLYVFVSGNNWGISDTNGEEVSMTFYSDGFSGIQDPTAGTWHPYVGGITAGSFVSSTCADAASGPLSFGDVVLFGDW